MNSRAASPGHRYSTACRGAHSLHAVGFAGGSSLGGVGLDRLCQQLSVLRSCPSPSHASSPVTGPSSRAGLDRLVPCSAANLAAPTCHLSTASTSMLLQTSRQPGGEFRGVLGPSSLIRRRGSKRRDLSCGVGTGAGVLGSTPWAVYASLMVAACLGLWSEKTKVGKELSGALVGTLVGMFMANTGIIPPGAPELGVVYKYLLPLAIPMLLMSANLKRILGETGRMLAAFLLGSLATVVGSLVAYTLVPLGPHFGLDGWKIAAALTARHIGGAVNYMAVADATELSPSVFGAGLAADDLILTLYFTSIFSLAKGIMQDKRDSASPDTDEGSEPSAPPSPSASRSAPSASGSAPSASGSAPSASGSAPSASGSAPSASGSAPSFRSPLLKPSSISARASGASFPGVQSLDSQDWEDHPEASSRDSVRREKRDAGSRVEGAGGSLPGPSSGSSSGAPAYKPIMVLEGTTALAISAVICHTSTYLAKMWGFPGHTITLITATTVLLATALPKLLTPLVPSAQGLARILMQIFCAAIGASANVDLVIRNAPILFLFSAVALCAHVIFILSAGKVLGFTRQELLLASNANIGGPSTVAGLATAKSWNSLMVPSILVSTLGYAIGTFVGMLVGHVGLSKMG